MESAQHERQDPTGRQQSLRPAPCANQRLCRWFHVSWVSGIRSDRRTSLASSARSTFRSLLMYLPHLQPSLPEWTASRGGVCIRIRAVGSLLLGSLRVAKFADYTAKLVVRGGIEPPAFRFSGAFAASLHVAGCGLMGDLAAQTVAGCRLTWPETCGR